MSGLLIRTDEPPIGKSLQTEFWNEGNLAHVCAPSASTVLAMTLGRHQEVFGY
jgi:hypothetical protein